jgi:flagellar biosynthesis protein FlhF
MKIKRFEASDMAEALRMVKKEFGEEAVILSARADRSS